MSDKPKKEKFGFSDIISDEPYHHFGFFEKLDKSSALCRAILHFRNDYDDVHEECDEILNDHSDQDIDPNDETDIRVLLNIVKNFQISLDCDFYNLETFFLQVAAKRGAVVTDEESEDFHDHVVRLRDRSAILGAMIEWIVLNEDHRAAMFDGYERRRWRDQGLEMALSAKRQQGFQASKNCIRAAKKLWSREPHLMTNISASARQLGSLELPELTKPDGSQLTPASIEKYLRKGRRDGAFDEIFPRKFRTPENPV